jgi:nucleoside-diphosphate-sugar epimerase
MIAGLSVRLKVRIFPAVARLVFPCHNAAVRAVLITGASGLTGSHLCEAFARDGWEVRALDQPGSDCTAAEAAGAKVSHVDLSRPEGALAAAELASGTQLVAHAAFPLRHDPEEAIDSVRAAMAAALQANAPFLLLSSSSVYGRPHNLPCEEGEPKLPIDLSGKSRWAVEREAFLWRKTKGLKLVVLRPALAYGPRQRRGLAVILAIAAVAAKQGLALWSPRRGPVLHVVHAQDVAQAAVLVGSDAASLDGRAFNVADDVPLPLEELLRALFHAVGAREAGRLPYSPRSARLVLWLIRKLPDWLLWNPLNRRLAAGWIRAFQGQPPLAPPRFEPDVLEQLVADRWYDTQRLRSLGFVPRWPSAVEGFATLALESRKQGLLPPPAINEAAN